MAMNFQVGDEIRVDGELCVFNIVEIMEDTVFAMDPDGDEREFKLDEIEKFPG